MVSKKFKESIIEEIIRIRSGLQEINTVHQSAIENELIHIINLLKKHILDKQNKLDKYIEKLEQLTNDKIASGLLVSVTIEMSSIGYGYAEILNFEATNKIPSSEVENLGILMTISSKLFQLIEKLEKVEGILDIEL